MPVGGQPPGRQAVFADGSRWSFQVEAHCRQILEMLLHLDRNASAVESTRCAHEYSPVGVCRGEDITIGSQGAGNICGCRPKIAGGRVRVSKQARQQALLLADATTKVDVHELARAQRVD